MPNDLRHWDARYQAVVESTWGANKAALMAYANGRTIPDHILDRTGSYTATNGRKPEPMWDSVPPKGDKMNDDKAIKLLTEIRDLLLIQAADTAPNYRYNLNDYPTFDWSAISATVTKNDASGAAVVRFANQLWTRRSGSGKYGKAIWFSRPNGKDDSGETQYLRLATFKEIEDAEPVSFQIATAPQKQAAPAPASGPADALAIGQRVKVQGNQGTKWGFIKHLASNDMASVQIGGQLFTLKTDRLQVA